MDRSDELEKPCRRPPDEAFDSWLESEVELKRLSLWKWTGISFKKRDIVLTSAISGLLEGSFSSII